MAEKLKKKQDSDLWPQVLQANALLTKSPGYLKSNALKINFKEKEYNPLIYSFETCTKQALGNKT